MENEPVQRCQNCLKDFPQSKMATHFGYCRRNIKKCPQCNQFYDINFKEQHQEEYHRQQECPHCKKAFPSDQFKSHERSCTQKPKYCEYCDLNVPVNAYPTHLKACEARTKPCTKCNLPIMNKEYYLHIVSCEGPKEEPKPTRSYQEHIEQQRRSIQQINNHIQKVNSREKIIIPSYQSKNRENKEYANNLEKRAALQEPKRISYIPPQQRQQVKAQEKKQYTKNQPPQPPQPKKDEPRKYPNAVVPPPPILTQGPTKKQDPRPIERISNQNRGPHNGSHSSNSNLSGNDPKNKGSGSRQPIKQATRSRQQQVGSIKEIASKNGGIGIKQSKSIERRNPQPAVMRKEEKQLNLDSTQTVYPRRIKAPQLKQKVIYQDKYPEPRIQQDNYKNFNHNQVYGAGLEEDAELQMAIMQSLGQEAKKKQSHNSFQMQMQNESFIEKQKAIQAEFKKEHRKR